jgi:peptidoglycan/LPS O-acetylase OafA/YrhL
VSDVPVIRERVEEFESLRGLMAMWVLLGHVALTFSFPAFEHWIWWQILCANRKAVDIFIVLSGFVIFYMLDAKREKYSVYLMRRFLRIFPAYIVCLIFSLMMVHLSVEGLNAIPDPSPRDVDRLVIFQSSLRYFGPHVLAHVTILHGLLPRGMFPLSDYAFIGQAWSISVEWQFYLLAPAAFFLATMQRRWAGLAALALLCATLYNTRRFFAEGYIGTQIIYFFIGCSSFFFWRMRRSWLETIARHSDLTIVVASGVWVLTFPRYSHIAIWIAVLLGCSAVRFEGHGLIASAISKVLRLPLLRWCGRISYSVYLVHMFVLYATLWLLRNSGLGPVGQFEITMITTIVATLLVAHGMYKWIEIPGITLGRLISHRQSPRRHMSAEHALS